MVSGSNSRSQNLVVSICVGNYLSRVVMYVRLYSEYEIVMQGLTRYPLISVNINNDFHSPVPGQYTYYVN